MGRRQVKVGEVWVVRGNEGRGSVETKGEDEKRGEGKQVELGSECRRSVSKGKYKKLLEMRDVEEFS